MMFTVDRPTNTDATHEKPAQRWDGVPSYLLRKDGTLINGLRPTNPDEQG